MHVLTMELRPGLGLKFARAIAEQQWVRDCELEPEVAAKRWATNSAAPPKRSPK